MSLRKTIGIIFTLLICISLGVAYVSLEKFFHSDAGCGCSSACTTFYPTAASRFGGYSLMSASVALFMAAVWKYGGLSRLWTLPALILFTVALYGNSYLIFNKGACGLSLYKSEFFLHQTKLGDYARSDAETLDPDSLKAGRYKGKLLGYAVQGDELTLFRIGAAPVKVKTGFLFWKLRKNAIINHISYGLNTHRNFEAEIIPGRYEFIGGQGMTEKDFLDEFVLTQKDIMSRRLKYKRVLPTEDGTTRFIFIAE